MGGFALQWPEVTPDMPRADWQERAACRGMSKLNADGELDLGPFEVGRGQQGTEAKKICAGCPVRPDCLLEQVAFEETRASSERPGIIAGGMSGAERYRWRKDNEELVADAAVRCGFVTGHDLRTELSIILDLPTDHRVPPHHQKRPAALLERGPSWLDRYPGEERFRRTRRSDPLETHAVKAVA